MTHSDSALKEFESLWQKAINQQPVHLPVEIKDVDNDFSPLPLFQRLSGLADSLDNLNLIESAQYAQMQTAIDSIKEVIETVDPAALSKALKSLN